MFFKFDMRQIGLESAISSDLGDIFGQNSLALRANPWWRGPLTFCLWASPSSLSGSHHSSQAKKIIFCTTPCGTPSTLTPLPQESEQPDLAPIY